MVLEIVAHAGQVNHHRNVQGRELRCRPHSREEQQVWGVDGPPREDHFLGDMDLVGFPVVEVGHADDVRPFKE